jgi:hypothetical protein
VSPLDRPSGISFFDEFYCRECGGREAYLSRPRSFCEKYGLPLLFLRAVRCERCFHRAYAWRSVPALERVEPGSKQSQTEPPQAPGSGSFIA